MADEPSLSQPLPLPPMLPSLPPQPPPLDRPKVCETTHPIHKTLDTVANLANLLPTGTVLAFRTLIPSFSNKGVCQLTNKFLTAAVIGFCSAACFFSSFTDSCVLSYDGGNKLYYGIATTRGIHLFHYYDNDAEKLKGVNMRKYKLKCVDFVHAFASLLVFLVFAFSDSDVQTCFFNNQTGANVNALVMNLPLAAGVFGSIVFLIFPTTRRGIGYAGLSASSE